MVFSLSVSRIRFSTSWAILVVFGEGRGETPSPRGPGIRGACVRASAQNVVNKKGVLVQVIGQARWSIPKGVLTAEKLIKIAVFGLIHDRRSKCNTLGTYNSFIIGLKGSPQIRLLSLNKSVFEDL